MDIRSIPYFAKTMFSLDAFVSLDDLHNIPRDSTDSCDCYKSSGIVFLLLILTSQG